MDSNEVIDLLNLAYDDKNYINQILDNTLELQSKITSYSLEHKQIIPKVEVKDYPKDSWDITDDFRSKYPIISDLINSDEIQERYWINECFNGLLEKDLFLDEYVSRIETEADVIK